MISEPGRCFVEVLRLIDPKLVKDWMSPDPAYRAHSMQILLDSLYYELEEEYKKTGMKTPRHYKNKLLKANEILNERMGKA